MNRKAVVVILGLAVLGYSAQAAQWQYKNNYFFSQTLSRAYSAAAEDPVGARDGAMAGYISQDPYNANSSTTSTIYDPNYASGGGSTYGYQYTMGSGAQEMGIYMTASSIGESASMNCFAEGSGWTVTSGDGGTDGMFFMIMPNAGENFGDLVRVRLSWYAYANGEGNSTVITNGGGRPRIAVSRTVLGAEQELWGRDGINLHNPSTFLSYYDNDDAIFVARIGDTIGIYMGASAISQFSGTYSGASVSMNLSLALKTVTPSNPADLNSDGKVDMQDLAIFAANWLWQAQWPNYHDTCDTAIEALLGTTYSGDTVLTDSGYVWYRFTPTEDGFYNFNLCGPNYLQQYIYDDCGGTQIGYSGWTCSSPPLRTHLTAGHTYYIAIYGGSEPSYPYEFSIDNTPIAAPANDDCTNAIPVEANGEVHGQIWSATGSDISSCINGDSMDVWYLFTAPNDGSYVFQVNPNNQFMAGSVSLYETDPLGCAGTELLCKSFPMEEGPGGHQGGGWPTLSMTAGQTILVRVASAPGHEGYFEMYVY